MTEKTEVLLAKEPKGYRIITAEGRMMTVTIGSARKRVPTSNADLSELWKTMMAYTTGTYRVEGEHFVRSHRRLFGNAIRNSARGLA